MGYNPWISAAKAAFAEVSSEDAKAFYKETAIAHTFWAMFTMLDMVYYTVEAGRKTREFINTWGIEVPSGEATTTEEVETEIAGYLTPAVDEPPVTTEAVITNQQKLETQITNTLREIYENVEIHQDGTELHQVSDTEIVEPLQEPVPSEVDSNHQNAESAPSRSKTRATKRGASKTEAKNSTGRVPRTRRQVSAE